MKPPVLKTCVNFMKAGLPGSSDCVELTNKLKTISIDRTVSSVVLVWPIVVVRSLF